MDIIKKKWTGWFKTWKSQLLTVAQLRQTAFYILTEFIYRHVSDTPPRLSEHSKLIRFEKPAAKTLQHGRGYGDILMLYDINTYE